MQSKRRLLVVDAPTGAPPEFYAPRLPKHLEVQVLVVAVSGAEVTAHRAQILGEYFPVTVVANDRELESTILRAAEEWGAEGVLAFSEITAHAAAGAARKLGLPSNPEPTQLALGDKLLQRRALQRGGVEVPAFYSVAEESDLEPALREVGLPAVLKPRRGMGSFAVFDVASGDELAAAYREGVAQYASDHRSVNYEPLFLLESKLIGARLHPDPRIGDYNSVDTIVGGGKAVHFSVEDKLPLAEPFRESGHLIPSTLPDESRQQLLDLVDRTVRALGITTGALQTEIKCTADGPRILEVNGRCGGGSPTILEVGGASDMIAIVADVALGGSPPDPMPFQRNVAWLTPQAPARRVRITRVPSAEDILRLPGVVTAEVVASVGAEPDWRRGTKSNFVRALAASQSREELIELARRLGSNEFFDYEVLDDPEQAEPVNMAGAAGGCRSDSLTVSYSPPDSAGSRWLPAPGVIAAARTTAARWPRSGSRDIEQLGSAHGDAEVELLKAAARQKLAAGQGELDLGLRPADPAGGGPPVSALVLEHGGGEDAAIAGRAGERDPHVLAALARRTRVPLACRSNSVVPWCQAMSANTARRTA